MFSAHGPLNVRYLGMSSESSLQAFVYPCCPFTGIVAVAPWMFPCNAAMLMGISMMIFDLNAGAGQ